jgi:hypothetical protein
VSPLSSSFDSRYFITSNAALQQLNWLFQNQL